MHTVNNPVAVAWAVIFLAVGLLIIVATIQIVEASERRINRRNVQRERKLNDNRIFQAVEEARSDFS